MRAIVVALVVSLIWGWGLSEYEPAMAETVTVDLSTSRADDIRWVEAEVGISEAEQVKIKILAPRRSGSGYKLFQVCRFPFTGSGKYSCGFDVSKGAIAHRYRGAWLARALLDGERMARIRFRL